MESAAWYNDEFGDHMVDTSKKERREYANKEALDELHGDHSFKTIHQKKGKRSEMSEGEAFRPGSQAKPMEVDSDGDDDEEYANLSSEERIALLKKTKLQAKKKAVGSQPNSERSGSGSSVEGEGSSSGSSSADSGSSSSVESMTDKAASPSSAEGNTAARKPGQSG
jgi:hypothetical protein